MEYSDQLTAIKLISKVAEAHGGMNVEPPSYYKNKCSREKTIAIKECEDVLPTLKGIDLNSYERVLKKYDPRIKLVREGLE